MSGVREPLSTYAIVQTGSKQYRVRAGDNIRVESLPVYTGEIVSIDDVLMISRDGNVKVGTPVVDGARVRAQVTSRGRGRKITVFKYKSKVRYRRTKGHRQHYTDLRIIDISMDGESLDAVEEVEETVDIVESDVTADVESIEEEAEDDAAEDEPVAEDQQAVEDDVAEDTLDEPEDETEADASVAEDDQADGDVATEDTTNENDDEPQSVAEPIDTDEVKEKKDGA